MTVAARRRDLDAVHAGLLRWFRSRHPGEDVRLGPLTQPSTGYSSETLLLEVVRTTGGVERTDALVARLPPAGGGIFPEYDLDRQACVQAALATTSVPVARPVAVESDEDWIGTPFFVMTRVAGFVLADTPSYVVTGPLHDATPAAQGRVQREFIDVLAAVHTLDWEVLGLGGLTDPDSRGCTGYLREARTFVEWSSDGNVPGVIDDALEWGRANLPDPQPEPSLLWGDPRLGNVVFGGDWHQVALLDWEMASIGPAELDLAWFLGLHAGSVRSAGADLPGFADPADVAARWSAVVGRPVEHYPWYEMLSLVRAESIFLRIRWMLLAAGLDQPWLRATTPGELRLAEIVSS